MKTTNEKVFKTYPFLTGISKIYKIFRAINKIFRARFLQNLKEEITFEVSFLKFQKMSTWQLSLKKSGVQTTNQKEDVDIGKIFSFF